MAASHKVAVVEEGYPKAQMDPERLKAVQQSILEAYDHLTLQGSQVRFERCTFRSGYLIVTCADKDSAGWLKEIVPSLSPWEGASLQALDGEALPKPHVCTTFVQDEAEPVKVATILNRLGVSNRGLRTNLWTVWGSTRSGKGTVWTFSMDTESMDYLKKANMEAYFGFGRLRFREAQGQPKAAQGNTTNKPPKPSTSHSPAGKPKSGHTKAGEHTKKDRPQARPAKGKADTTTQAKGSARKDRRGEPAEPHSPRHVSPLLRTTVQEGSVMEVDGGSRKSPAPEAQ